MWCGDGGEFEGGCLIGVIGDGGRRTAAILGDGGELIEQGSEAVYGGSVVELSTVDLVEAGLRALCADSGVIAPGIPR